MGDILPLKRQAVVDRLRRRFDLQYRRHQEGCYPRYEQAANGLFEQQRQETQILKQRYLEAKAKKLKKSEQKSAKEPCVNNASADSQRSLLVQKLNKRQVDSSPIGLNDSLTNNEEGSDPRPKIQRKSQNQEQIGNRDQLPNNNNNNNTQSQQNQQQLPSFSVQIVQQFTSSSSAQSQHSQTIQTNVTVKALGGNIKSSNSPLDGAAAAAAAAGNTSSGSGAQDDDLHLSAGTSISVECKRERDTEFRQCSNFNHREQSSASNTSQGGLGTGSGAGGGSNELGHGHGDRFPDTFANLACFPEDSNDDVINADILNDINTNDFFDDIFTNPTDLMKEFNFDDSVGSVRDHSEDNEKDPSALGNASLSDMGKGQPNAFQFPPQQGLTFEGGAGPPGMVGASAGGFPPRMTGYSPLSPTLAGLDFKLREPSPAAQTLKQMAEQHQSMQQKQHQIGLGLGPPHPSRSPFGPDSFNDPLSLSSIRTNFLNGANMNTLSKVPGSGNAGPGPLYNALPFAQQAGPQTPGAVQPTGHSPAGHSPGSYVAGLRSGNSGGMVFKQETGTTFPNMSGQLNSSDSMDIHKRQNVQRITPDSKPHLDQFGTAPSPVDQKPCLTQSPVSSGGAGAAGGPQSQQQQQQQQARQPSPSQASSQAPYAGTRPLSHFTDHPGVHAGLQASPSANNRGSPSSMPTLPGTGTFIRGLTPPPSGGPQHFSTTVPIRSPSRTTNLQISQSQQLQISQSNHQLQVSQSQQIQLNQELKPSTPTHTPPAPPPQPQQAQPQGPSQGPPGSHEGPGVYGSYVPNGSFQLSMSQSQNVSFTSHQYGSPTGASTPPSNQMETSRTHPVVTQQQQQHMAGAQRGPNMQQQQQQHNFMNRPPPPEYKAMGKQPGPRYSGPIRSGPMGSYSGPEARTAMPGAPILPVDVLQSQFNPQTLNVSMVQQQQMTAKGANNQKPVYASTLLRNRAPNVNVGPEGLNISQKPPFEWRQMMLQQQQQQQQHHQQQQRMPMPRYPQCYSRPMQPNAGQFLNGPPMVRAGHPQQQAQPQPQTRLPSMVPRTQQHPQQHPRLMLVQHQQQMMMQSAIGNMDANSGVTHHGQQPSPQQQQQQLTMQLNSASSASAITMDPSSGIQFGDPSLQSSQSGHGDPNSFSLDFLDNIESSASDLLNFDSVSGAHFSLLDEMGMLGK